MEHHFASSASSSQRASASQNQSNCHLPTFLFATLPLSSKRRHTANIPNTARETQHSLCSVSFRPSISHTLQPLSPPVHSPNIIGPYLAGSWTLSDLAQAYGRMPREIEGHASVTGTPRGALSLRMRALTIGFGLVVRRSKATKDSPPQKHVFLSCRTSPAAKSVRLATTTPAPNAPSLTGCLVGGASWEMPQP